MARRKQGRYYVSTLVSQELIDTPQAWAQFEPVISPQLQEQAQKTCEALATSRTRYRMEPLREGRSDDMWHMGAVRFFLKFDAVREWVKK
jgi:hypothetical protein